MKKIIIILGTIISLLVVSVVVWIKFMPADKLTQLAGKNSAVSQIACLYPFKIAGQSMEPKLQAGDKINFSKCFKQDQLTVGTIISFKDNGVIRLSTIREITNANNGIIYKTSQEARQQVIIEVTSEQIIAVYQPN